MMLTRPLDCTSSGAEEFTLPAGYMVGVHPPDGARCLVVLDGRVYRASAAAVQAATVEVGR